MGFVSKILNDVDGIQNYYILGLLIFVTLFFVMIYRTIKIPKQDLINYKTSILDSNEFDSNKIK